jgi:hypothetical protein
MALPLLLLLGVAAGSAAAAPVTLSNTQLPLDTSGSPLVTGEASLLQSPQDGAFYLYANDWGGCKGIDCCAGTHGCAYCCFQYAPYTDPCVYTDNHTVNVYRTADFATWDYLGVALSTNARRAGIEFRPQVVFNGTAYVMWYEDRWSGGQKNGGYAVAVSRTPAGPFVTLADSVVLPGAGRVGDYDLFVDDDGSAYHVRTGLSIVKLSADMCSGSSTAVDVPNGGVEGGCGGARGGAGPRGGGGGRATSVALTRGEGVTVQ